MTHKLASTRMNGAYSHVIAGIAESSLADLVSFLIKKEVHKWISLMLGHVSCGEDG